jgi:A/G-specific adenine glycosylase
MRPLPDEIRTSRTAPDDFRRVVWNAYREHYRPMEWRDDPSPYKVFVSEVMLQQTQVVRVRSRFSVFVDRFGSFGELAAASFSAVLEVWSGLGYNRRARRLLESARIIRDHYRCVLPRDPEKLRELPGIGAATAGSIAAFAYNVPAVFIETNIRRVFLHHFFPGRDSVRDREILPLVEATLDHSNPREWYWALMDYGTILAERGANANQRSAHYTVQSPFEGSDRQLRGIILRDLTGGAVFAAEAPPDYNGFSGERVQRVVRAMEREGLLERTAEGTVVLSE